jgi:uncharacterized membrane protein
MISYLTFISEKFSKSMSLRATLYCILSTAVVLSANSIGYILPECMTAFFSPETLDQLLKIISSSMLVVLTFSLSIVVTAYSSASKATF